MKNRFNNIDSKEWLKFQKSWFLFQDDATLYRQHIRFFIKYDHPDYPPNLFYHGSSTKAIEAVAQENGAHLFTEPDASPQFQYALIDLREAIQKLRTRREFVTLRNELQELVRLLYPRLVHRRFLTILASNRFLQETYFPLAWELAYSLFPGFSLKDEKIGCVQEPAHQEIQNDIFYVLNFRKDENATGEFLSSGKDFSHLSPLPPETTLFPRKWEIIKPPPRKKKEILHPAKFPENLVEQFITRFTREGDNVFDPMSGTGSTQLAALKLGRNGYGVELSEYFSDIARERLEEFLRPHQHSLFPESRPGVKYRILTRDVREISAVDFPPMDYLITSPPYWDMLNMKGAEYQARRREKGLPLKYSDDTNDLGNIHDYQQFLQELVEIYLNLLPLLKPGSYLTIVVKNIKKKGRNYPFAWDLAHELSRTIHLLPEFFWLQDDIQLAPYGYGNTFVSNTFHQYCLTFRKPLSSSFGA